MPTEYRGMCHPASQPKPIVGRTRVTGEGAHGDRDWFRERMIENDDQGPAWCESRYVQPWEEEDGSRRLPAPTSRAEADDA